MKRGKGDQMNIFKKRKREPATHDWTKWSGMLTPYDNGQRITMHGWHGAPSWPQKGEYIVLWNKDTNAETRYQVTEMKKHHDGSEMWTCRATFAPRSMPKEGERIK
jgi:hypothetical protein